VPTVADSHQSIRSRHGSINGTDPDTRPKDVTLTTTDRPPATSIVAGFILAEFAVVAYTKLHIVYVMSYYLKGTPCVTAGSAFTIQNKCRTE
jgi:hypothetical protein